MNEPEELPEVIHDRAQAKAHKIAERLKQHFKPLSQVESDQLYDEATQRATVAFRASHGGKTWDELRYEGFKAIIANNSQPPAWWTGENNFHEAWQKRKRAEPNYFTAIWPENDLFNQLNSLEQALATFEVKDIWRLSLDYDVQYFKELASICTKKSYYHRQLHVHDLNVRHYLESALKGEGDRKPPLVYKEKDPKNTPKEGLEMLKMPPLSNQYVGSTTELMLSILHNDVVEGASYAVVDRNKKASPVGFSKNKKGIQVGLSDVDYTSREAIEKATSLISKLGILEHDVLHFVCHMIVANSSGDKISAEGIKFKADDIMSHLGFTKGGNRVYKPEDLKRVNTALRALAQLRVTIPIGSTSYKESKKGDLMPVKSEHLRHFNLFMVATTTSKRSPDLPIEWEITPDRWTKEYAKRYYLMPPGLLALDRRNVWPKLIGKYLCQLISLRKGENAKLEKLKLKSLVEGAGLVDELEGGYKRKPLKFKDQIISALNTCIDCGVLKAHNYDFDIAHNLPIDEWLEYLLVLEPHGNFYVLPALNEEG